MSTLAYAAFTNKRESAVPDSSSTISPGVKTYVDALAALVPAEVLTLHGLILTVTTKELDGGKAEIVTGALPTLQISFWLLALLCIPLFAVPRAYGGKWDRFDFVRMMIAPLAFVGWTMLQPMTAFDAAFETLPQIPRVVTALFLGAVLGGVTAALASKADAKLP